MKKKWSDYDDEEDEEKVVGPVADKDNLTMVEKTEPDENGIRIVTGFRTNQNGQRVKVTRRVKETRRVSKLKKKVLERRKWIKFGACLGKLSGLEPNVSVEERDHVYLDVALEKEKEKKQVEQKQKQIAECNHCHQFGHTFLWCPERAKNMPPSMKANDAAHTINNRSATNTSASQSNDADSKVATDSATTAAPVGATPNDNQPARYVPPNRRTGDRIGMSRMTANDDHSQLRVSNLPEDANEDDLRQLFRPFGFLQRVFLVKDKITFKSRGFAYIGFEKRSEAQKAQLALNGYGYANLILSVEWAAPRDHTN